MNNLKSIFERILDLKNGYLKSSDLQKKRIKQLAIVSLILFLVIFSCEFFSFSLNKSQPVTDINEISQNDKTINDVKLPIEPSNNSNGIGFDLLNPVDSIVNPINDALTSILKQAVGLYDNYVAFTPDITEHNGNIKGADGSNIRIDVDKFYNLISTLAWILLPLMIMINGTVIILEPSFRGRELALIAVKKLLFFAVGMITMRFLFSLGIQLTNAIDSAVINGLIGQGAKLSEAIISALGISPAEGGKLAFQDQGVFNIFSQLIIWIALFFFMITILFQFIIRFFHLLLNILLHPIAMVVGLLPGGWQFFKSYLEDIVRSLAAQPVFLIGLAIVIAIIQSGTGSITKLMLGLGSLLFLNTINSIVAKFSGMLWTGASFLGAGIVTAATIGQAGLLKRGLIKGATGEGSGSIRMAGAKALGEKLGGNLPIVGKNRNRIDFSKPSFATSSTLMDNQKSQGAFGKALSFGKGGADSAFSSIGMNPLKPTDLKNDTAKATLFSTTPDFTPISNVSLADSNKLSSSYVNSHYDSFMGDYPLTDKPVNLGNMIDTTSFKPSNPETLNHMNSVIPHKQQEVQIKNMFDTGDSTHMNHMSQWYAKNESLSNNTKFDDAYKFAQNPSNRMDVLRRASSEGYFRSQKINYVKSQDQVNGETINKYYQLYQPKNAGNRASKTKSK